MIGEALQFIIRQLNLAEQGQAEPTTVRFPEEAPGDTIKLADRAITLVLVRVEEERVMRQDEPYFRFSGPKTDGEARTVKKAFPPVVLNLYVLFAARYPDYKTGLDFLSKIVTFFQGSPVFTAGLPANLPELRMELHSPTFTAQNEIWSMLKAPYHPSVMYKVTLVLLEKVQSETTAPIVQKKIEPARAKILGQEHVTDESPIKQAIVNHPS